MNAEISACNAKIQVALREIYRLNRTLQDSRRQSTNFTWSRADYASISTLPKGHYWWNDGYGSPHSSWKGSTPDVGHKLRSTKMYTKNGSIINNNTWYVQGTKLTNIFDIKNITSSTTLVPATYTIDDCRAIADSGFTSHFLISSTNCTYQLPTICNIPIGLPNIASIRSTNTALIPFP